MIIYYIDLPKNSHAIFMKSVTHITEAAVSTILCVCVH